MIRTTKLVILGVMLGLVATPAASQTYYNWMSPEIKDAWSQGYKGQGATITEGLRIEAVVFTERSFS